MTIIDSLTVVETINVGDALENDFDDKTITYKVINREIRRRKKYFFQIQAEKNEAFWIRYDIPRRKFRHKTEAHFLEGEWRIVE